MFIVLDAGHKDRRHSKKQAPKFKLYSQPCPTLQPQGTFGGLGGERGRPADLLHAHSSVPFASLRFRQGLHHFQQEIGPQFIISDFCSRKIRVFGNPVLENGAG